MIAQSESQKMEIDLPEQPIPDLGKIYIGKQSQ